MIEYLAFHSYFFILVVIFVALMDKNISIFSPVAWYFAFHLLVFVIKPIVFYLGDFSYIYTYIGYFPADEDKTKALFITDIALVSFLIGFYIRGLPSNINATVWDFSFFHSKRSVDAFKYMALFVIPLIIISLIKTGGGFSYDGSTGHEMELVNGISINVNTTGYLTELKNMMTPFFFLLFVVFGRAKWVVYILAAYVVYRLYLGWERIHIVVLLLSVLLFNLMKINGKWFKFRIVVIALVLLPMFSFLGENRDYIKSFFDSSVVIEVDDDRSFLEKLDNLDFANFEYLTYIVSVVPELSNTYSYWTQYLQIFTEPIPRIVWKDKPIGMPISLVNLNDWGNFLGLTKSIVGDSWISFGYLGVFINLFLIGFLLRKLFDSNFVFGSNISKVGWLTIIPFSIQLFRDGGIISISKFLLFAMLPLLVWLLFYKLGNRK